MLWFIGLGISGSKSIPSEAVEILSQTDIVYLEQFTSPISKLDLVKIKKMIKDKFEVELSRGHINRVRAELGVSRPKKSRG